MITDSPLDYFDWSENAPKSEWVIRTLKLFFYSLNNFSQENAWCRWPAVVNTADELFFKDAAKIVEQVIDDFDNYLVDQALDM